MDKTADEAKKDFEIRLAKLASDSRFEPFQIVVDGRYMIYQPSAECILVLDRSWRRLHHFDMRSDHLSWLGCETLWGFTPAKQRMVAPDREVGMMLAHKLYARVYDKVAEARARDKQADL